MKLPIKYHDGKRIETIRSAIRASARRYSARPAIMQKFAGSYREISYAELLYKVEGLGTELLARGFYGKKIIVYRYKRKTGYHKKNGHRQAYTAVKIDKINA